MFKKIAIRAIAALAGIFILFLVAGFIGVIVDPLFKTDLTDGSLDGSEDTLGLLGFGIGFAFLFGGVAMIAVLGKSIQVLRTIRTSKIESDSGSKERRRWIKIAISSTTLALFISGALFVVTQVVSNSNKGDDATETEYMPSLINLSLPEAKKVLKDLSADPDVATQDLISSRSVWAEENWTVISQSPSVGLNLSKVQKVCIGIVKNDETWETPNRLECWSDASSELKAIGDNYEMPLKDLLKVGTSPQSLIGYQLRATVEIEMDRGNTVQLPYCTYAQVAAPAGFNLKLDAGNGGDPGLFANGGESFKAGLFLEWTGKYRFSIKKLEKSLTSKCGS